LPGLTGNIRRHGRKCPHQRKVEKVDKLEQNIRDLKFDRDGLIPAICVDAASGKVLMMAYMNAESALETIRTGKTHFWSRSRGKQWVKGESSGHVQEVKAVYVDCDNDTLLIEVAQHGGACHAGYYSCFFRKLDEHGQWQVVAEKVFEPDRVYKNSQ